MVNLTFGAFSTNLNSDSVATAEQPPTTQATTEQSSTQTTAENVQTTPPESQQTTTEEKPSVEATTEGSTEEKSPVDGFFEYLDKNPEAKEQVLQKLGEIFKKDS